MGFDLMAFVIYVAVQNNFFELGKELFKVWCTFYEKFNFAFVFDGAILI